MKGSSANKLVWAVERCRERGLRKTFALEAVLSRLIDSDRPLTLANIAESKALRGRCDPATVYRMLVRLEEKGIIRRLGLHDRAAYYTIHYPDQHHDYLICTECGSIDTLDIPCPVESLEKTISTRFGFKKLYHELEFFGVCSDCD